MEVIVCDPDRLRLSTLSRNLQEVENRRFEAAKATIEAERNIKIDRAKEVMESQVRAIQGNIKTLAGLLPPIPVFAVGIGIFMRRRRREKEGAGTCLLH